MKDIIELKFRGECKMAVGNDADGRHLFCGAVAPEGQVYCSSCARGLRIPTRKFPDSAAVADAWGGGRSRSPSRGDTGEHSYGVKPVDGYIKLGSRLLGCDVMEDRRVPVRARA